MSAGVMLAHWNCLSSLKKAEPQSMTVRNPGYRQQGWKGLFTRNMFPKLNQWVTFTVLRFWRDWDSLFVTREQRNRNYVHRLCIMTVHPHTQITCFRFFSKSWHSCGSATTLLPWHGCVWLIVVSQTWSGTKREEIRWRHLSREYDERHE